MKGTPSFCLLLLLGCLLYRAAAHVERPDAAAVQTRRLVHSPVANYHHGGCGYKGGYGGGYGGYGGYGYGGGGYGGYGGYGYGCGHGGYGGYGGYGYGGRGYGGYGGCGCGGRGYGGYGGYGYGGYGGYGHGGRGCGCGGYHKGYSKVFLNVNLHGRPGFPSIGKVPFFNEHFGGGFPLFGGGFHGSPFLGKLPFFNRYVNYFPSAHHGYFLGGSFPFPGKFHYPHSHHGYSYFGGAPYSYGGYGKGYGYH